MSRPIHTAPNARQGFTLVELMVVIVIVSILSALSLAGLNVARQRSKIDATRTTIRKIDSFVTDTYEQFFVRQIPPDSHLTSSRAMNLGRLMTYQMPDQWQDVLVLTEAATLRSGSATAFLSTGPVNKYARLINTLGGQMTPAVSGSAARSALGKLNSSAECLFLSVIHSGFSPSALEDFRPNEVGDTDNDGAKEFLDASGQPIFFIRWAPGFSDPSARGGVISAIQASPLSILANPDPIYGTLPVMVPLIYACGRDGASATAADSTDYYGLERPKNRVTFDPFEFPDAGKPLVLAAPGSVEYSAYRDNVTNHDFLGRGR